MAEVYVARARGISGFEKLVAIKVIHPRYSEDEHFVELLVEEAKISVLLTHVNVGQIFDLGVVDNTYYIALEYIEGADAYRMQRKASDAGVSVPIDVCTFIAAEVCHGLDYAHRKRDADGKPLGIVHRDISPQNVLISFAGEVKIVDFGIAKAALRRGQTEAGVIKGKYYYMSPEQAWGDPMDHRSDIFSAGIVLYELLIGEMLYREDNIPALLDRVRKAEIAPPHTRRAEASPELSAIVMRALAKQPEDRFQSAHEMAQALMQLLYKTAPSFTSARVAQFMSQLFPVEIRKNAELAALASDENDEAGAEAPRKAAPAKADPTRAVAARLPARSAPAREPMPTAAPPARAGAFELGDDEAEEDDATRNDVMPFRRALAMMGGAATGPTNTEEVPAPISEDPTRAVSGRMKREDATGPLRGGRVEREPDWEDDATSVLGGAAGARVAALAQGAAPAAVRAAVPAPDDTGAEADWDDDSTMVDDGAVSARIPAMLQQRAAAKAAAPAPALRPPPAKPRSMPPPAKPRSMPPPARRAPPPPRAASSALAPPRVPRMDAAPAAAPPSPQRPQPQAAQAPPPYPQAYVQPAPQPAAPQRPQPQAPPEAQPQPQPQAQRPPQSQPQAQAPVQAQPQTQSQPQPQAQPQPPPQMPPQFGPAPRFASPFEPVGYAPASAPVATSWPPAGAPPSLDPRTGAAFDPFAPPPTPGAATALYPAVSAEGGSRRGLIFALLAAVLVAVLVVLGVSAFYASRKATPPPQIASVPSGAHVRVDGVDVPGVTPLVLPAPLDPERAHDIDVTLDQFEPYRIVVPAGDRQASHLAILTPK